MKLITAILALLISTNAFATQLPITLSSATVEKAPCTGVALTQDESVKLGKVLVAFTQAIQEKKLEDKFNEYIQSYTVSGYHLNLVFLLKAYDGGMKALARRINPSPSDKCELLTATPTEAAALGLIYTLMNDFLVANKATDAVGHYASNNDMAGSTSALSKLHAYITKK